MFNRTHFVYLARPLDFAYDSDLAAEATKLLRGAGLAIYDPGTAFDIPERARPGSTVTAINHAALDACDGLMCLFPAAGRASIGVPEELGRARAHGKPALVVADQTLIERSWALQPENALDPDYRIVSPLELRERDTRWLGIRMEQNRARPKPASQPMFFKIEEGARIPTRSHEGDAGFDLYVQGNHIIPPGDNYEVPSGVSVQLPEDHWALITGRSSTIRKLGLHVTNGVIDQGYRGPLYANVQNMNELPVEVTDGQRLAQLIPFPLTSARLHPTRVDVLADSDRGSKGFGSSGA